MAASLTQLANRVRRRAYRAKTLLVPEPPLADVLAPLPDKFRTRLMSLYASEPQLGAGGRTYPLDYITRISPAEGMWLYQLCRQTRPENTLEIGLGYGFSAIYILAALYANGAGHHTAIDPFQLREDKQFRGIGLQHASELDMASAFTFFLDRSVPVLVDLAKQEKTFEVIFIDGGHLFDEAFLDFTLSAVLCPVGGHIVLDDTWMPAIRRVVHFIRTNRQDFTAVKSHVDNVAVFRRTANDDRDWNHFVEFNG